MDWKEVTIFLFCDNLEQWKQQHILNSYFHLVAGIPEEKLVEAHGTFSTATCVRCYKKHKGDIIKVKLTLDLALLFITIFPMQKKVLRGIIPRCQGTELCWGVVKPDIVFFGEDLPKRFYYYLKDFPKCDLLLIMGTSLEVSKIYGFLAYNYLKKFRWNHLLG